MRLGRYEVTVWKTTFVNLYETREEVAADGMKPKSRFRETLKATSSKETMLTGMKP